MEKQIDLDRLDQFLIETIDKEQSIELTALHREYPDLREIPYSTLWYRIDSLAAAGYIRIERARKTITCFSVQTKSMDAMSTKSPDAPNHTPYRRGDQRRRENQA